MSDLADEIRSMVFAFDAGDGRRDAVRALADRVEVMHEALCNVINRWTRHKVGDDGDPCQCSRCLAVDALPFASEPLPRFFTEAEAREQRIRDVVAQQWVVAISFWWDEARGLGLDQEEPWDDADYAVAAALAAKNMRKTNMVRHFARMPCAVDLVEGGVV